MLTTTVQSHPDPVEALVSDVDEFLSYLAIVKTPEVDAVRESLERSLGKARSDLLTAVNPARVSAFERNEQRFVSMHRYVAVAAAAVLGAFIGTVGAISRHRLR